MEVVNRINFTVPIKAIKPKPLGITKDLASTLELAFDLGVTQFVYLEDDILVSPDALRLAHWYFTHPKYSDDQAGLAFCREESAGNDASRPAEVAMHSSRFGLLGQGWAFTRNQYVTFIRPYWSHWHPACPTEAWDYNLAVWAQVLNKSVWRPRLSRSRHCGAVGSSWPNREYPSLVATQKIYYYNDVPGE
jgi:hypothetical protein